jgi:uncharacterized protein YecA (UPF0149 family)
MVEYCSKWQCSSTEDGKMTLRDAFRRLIAGPELPAVPNLGRNDGCWCGSGRKYKACHQMADDRKRSTMRSSRPRRS